MTDPHAKRVYIAGPYKGGKTWEENLRQAIDAAEHVWKAGHYPYIPHAPLWALLHPKPRDEWLELDFAWIDACDALIRLPGESVGVDAEVEYARENGIPVYNGPHKFLDSEGVSDGTL